MLKIIFSNNKMRYSFSTGQFQLTVLVHLTFKVHLDWDGNPNTRIVNEYHLYINDDKVHDNLFLQQCFGLHNQYLESQGHPMPIEYIVFSYGCSLQFKCERSLFYVAHYPSLTKCPKLLLGTYMQWNYFGSGHRKGCWDAVGTSIKQALKVEQVKPNGVQLHNALDVVSFLQRRFNQEHVTYSQVRRNVKCSFYEVKLTYVNKVDQFNAQTIIGTRSLHQVCNVGLDEILLQT